MKKQILRYLLSSFVLVSMAFHFSSAQTAVNIYYAYDSVVAPACPPPLDAQFYMYGLASGFTVNDSIDCYINFGDGTDTTVRVPIMTPNTYFTAGFNHSYTMAGQYSEEFIATGPGGYADTVVYYNKVIVGDTCGNISGTIYIDANSNCIMDAGDTPLPWFNVQLLSGATVVGWSYSDSVGNYYFDVPTGIPYTIQIGNYYNSNFSTVCPVSGNYYVGSAPSSGNDFAITCNPGFDLTGNLNGWGFRPGGQAAYLWLAAYNMRCTPQSGQVRLVIDPLVTVNSSNPVAASVSGDTMTWNFSNLSSTLYYYWWNSFWANLHLTTSPTAAIGDTVCFTLIVEPITGDANDTNNIQTFCFPVRNSWDPNDKSVSPVGVNPGGRILPDVSAPLTYTVNFQNTGTDTAYSIFIMDTIDSDLDITTFKVLSSSHQMDVDIYQGDAVKFSFNNIMLPDSGANQEGSHGFVVYSIKQKPNLGSGTIISNTAGIYFDFNPAVVTNTTVNTIDITLSAGKPVADEMMVRLSPNPCSNEVSLIVSGDMKSQRNASLKIFDVVGREVMSMPVALHNGDSGYRIPVSNLSAGVYIVQFQSAGKKQSLKMVKE